MVNRSQLQDELHSPTKELDELAPTTKGQDLTYWRNRAATVLEDIVGATDALVIQFVNLRWKLNARVTRPDALSAREPSNQFCLEAARGEARGILQAALWRLQRQPANTGAE